ncbi:hypothetical protein GCM10010182_01130 [Actinomadura cremea]|nr:hypothetical protein GCM10010182_01130 [Actinomadura cremea]
MELLAVRGDRAHASRRCQAPVRADHHRRDAHVFEAVEWAPQSRRAPRSVFVSYHAQHLGACAASTKRRLKLGAYGRPIWRGLPRSKVQTGHSAAANMAKLDRAPGPSA